jgi:hypothetical protein
MGKIMALCARELLDHKPAVQTDHRSVAKIRFRAPAGAMQKSCTN